MASSAARYSPPSNLDWPGRAAYKMHLPSLRPLSSRPPILHSLQKHLFSKPRVDPGANQNSIPSPYYLDLAVLTAPPPVPPGQPNQHLYWTDPVLCAETRARLEHFSFAAWLWPLTERQLLINPLILVATISRSSERIDRSTAV
jgi:hypothetical protein